MINEILLSLLSNVIPKKNIIVFMHEFFNSPLVIGIIGAMATLLAGILGGVIAFYIARLQIINERKNKMLADEEMVSNYKSLIKLEIKDNRIFLMELKNFQRLESINSVLKFSLSDSIYLKIQSNLIVDEFYLEIHKYYKLLSRLRYDETLIIINYAATESSEIPTISNIDLTIFHEELDELIKISNNIIS